MVVNILSGVFSNFCNNAIISFYCQYFFSAGALPKRAGYGTLGVMERTLVVDTVSKIGERVRVAGWVSVRRDHGRIVFIDLRDRTGTLQVVFTPGNAEAHALAQKLRSEWVVVVEGLVQERPKGMQNANTPTGAVELPAEKLEIIAEAATPPFPLDTAGYDIEEELRLKYRYLDLRRERLAKNICLRHRVTTLVREYLNANGFVEIETPLLTKTSPEGARDFLVPSRLYPGKFYALPQAPQQYKQLLMIAGFERYYQIARALRDEDARGDRQPEHTQIDLEMSFATEQDVLALAEGMMIRIAEECGKKIWKKPFPVFTHEEAMNQFGADKFDLRSEPKDPDMLAFAWVVDFPLFEVDEMEGLNPTGRASGYSPDGSPKRFTFAHNPFSAPKAEHVEKLMNGEDLASIRAQQYDLVCNGCELASGGMRISDAAVQRKVFEVMGLTPEETEERFGHLIHAYEYGAPPHAGIAPGLDRLVMLLANEPNISEVIAFPKTGNARDPMMGSPSEITAKQLKELHIKVD